MILTNYSCKIYDIGILKHVLVIHFSFALLYICSLKSIKYLIF
jgi:hypothetical protein